MPLINRMEVVRVRVQQINEVGVVKTVEFFVHVFVCDVRYKFISIYVYMRDSAQNSINDQKQCLSLLIYHIYRFVL